MKEICTSKNKDESKMAITIDRKRRKNVKSDMLRTGSAFNGQVPVGFEDCHFLNLMKLPIFLPGHKSFLLDICILGTEFLESRFSGLAAG